MSKFKNKTEKDLYRTLREKRETLRSSRFSTAGTRTRNVKEASNLKRDIARVLTELNRRASND